MSHIGNGATRQPNILCRYWVDVVGYRQLSGAPWGQGPEWSPVGACSQAVILMGADDDNRGATESRELGEKGST